jgi:hypothetical protein
MALESQFSSCIMALVSEECIFSVIRVEIISELGKTLAMKNVAFWDVTPCGYCTNRLSGV